MRSDITSAITSTPRRHLIVSIVSIASLVIVAAATTSCASTPDSASAGEEGSGGAGEAIDDPPEPSESGSSSRPMLLGPEISHSRGVDGGLVLLWPRVIPRAQTAALRVEAKALQDRLKAMLEEHFPGRPIDVRPEPERVCPKPDGCIATSIGLLIGWLRGECVAVVIVSPPGPSEQLLMPWAGLVTTKLTVPFREPPESNMRIHEMVPCDKLPIATLEREERVRQALKIAE